jgi:aspartyl-tRNA(Asn)/glutamyl-tRNA(Gln) amidotransferase subunit C
MTDSSMTPDIRHLATLARLEMTDDEIAEFSTQLGRILDYANVVSQVDTTGVEPVAQGALSEFEPPRWREDEPRPSIDREAALRAAPDADVAAGLFRVPKVL